MIDLSPTFKNRIIGCYGKEGKRWLKELPSHLRDIKNAWTLRLETPSFTSSYHYLVLCRTPEETDAVLKLGVPHHELEQEIEALNLFNGLGAVTLLRSDRKRGAMLLEQLDPGRPLADLKDHRQAAQIAAGVCQKLWSSKPPEYSFPTIEDWGEGFDRLRHRFDGGTGPFPPRIVHRAEDHHAHLLQSMGEPALLHGDLHHGNILKHGKTWLALDPKGVIGEPAYEIGAFLRNPWPDILAWKNFTEITAERLMVFHETLALDRQRMLLWAFSQSVLAAWWSYEEHSDQWQMWMRCARQFSSMLP